MFDEIEWLQHLARQAQYRNEALLVIQTIHYLRAQEQLLDEWQQRASDAEAKAAEVARPLDEQMARLNQNLIDINQRAMQANMEANAQIARLRADLDAARAEVATLAEELLDLRGSFPVPNEKRLMVAKAIAAIAAQEGGR